MVVIFQTGLGNRNADNLLKGLLQGVLMYHAVLSTNQAITGALFLGICGRLVSDFVTRRDSWKTAITLLGIAFGVLMADVVSYLYGDREWNALTFIDDITNVQGEHSHRPFTRRRLSEPRRIEELPAVYEELSSIDSQSRAGNEDLSEPDKEVARLRAKALHAAGQERKFREERKWALSQGNLARAFQLRWQVKKYHALAVSYTREADQRLIEGKPAIMTIFRLH
ncbi:hypothetical protein BU17DRAFT_46735 [Hysterangium stoloniferum]|nr:hypothetical protein BU17DRAFT_46735 [Hysterangium stoloniferum]